MMPVNAPADGSAPDRGLDRGTAVAWLTGRCPDIEETAVDAALDQAVITGCRSVGPYRVSWEQGGGFTISVREHPRYQRGDRIVLLSTTDPHTRLRRGDEGTVTRWNPAQGTLGVAWDSGSTLIMLLADGDDVAPAARPGTGHARSPEPDASGPLPPAARGPARHPLAREAEPGIG